MTEVFLREGHPLFDKLMTKLTTLYDTRNLNIENAVVLTGLAMQMVQKTNFGLTKLSGDAKKQLVTDMIVATIEKANVDQVTKESLTKVFIPIILPQLIDGMCRLGVNTPKAKGCWCF